MNASVKRNCPGSSNIRTPELAVRECPQCGEGIEIFSDEAEAYCRRCGLMVFNELNSCLQWCRYAAECAGPGKTRELSRMRREKTE